MENYDPRTSNLYSAPVLYIYEWMVTLDQEIYHIWARKWTFSTCIFAVNRYSALLIVIIGFSPAASRVVRFFKTSSAWPSLSDAPVL